MLLVSTKIHYLLPRLLAAAVITGCGFKAAEADSVAKPPESKPAAELAEADAVGTQSTSLPETAPLSKTPVSPPDAASVTVQDAVPPLTPDALWEQLQEPGDTLYVVLIRHALAPGTGDPTNFQLTDCTTQRNLSAAGRSQAQQIGQAFHDRHVVVQQVLSSQWCRCLETAELMDVGTVEPYPPLNSFFRDRSTAEAQITAVKQYLLSQADHPGVTIMVTHQVNITGLTDIVPQSGEAVVLQVEASELTQMGQLRPELSSR
ncbi:MAG: histidine phosphatase family protein [Cyanobacteria bacterium P01_C01_bin.147]